MNRRARVAIIASVALLTLFGSVMLYACGGGRNDGRGFGSGCLTNVPDLTADQKAKINKVCLDCGKTMLEYRKEMMELRFKMRQERRKESPDYTKIASYLKEKDQLRKKMLKEKEKRCKEVYSILTPAQKEKCKGMNECSDQQKWNHHRRNAGRRGCGGNGRGRCH